MPRQAPTTPSSPSPSVPDRDDPGGRTHPVSPQREGALSMHRRWLTAAAVALTAAASTAMVVAGPAGVAAATTPDTGQFGLAPVAGADGQARGYFQLSAGPGGSVTDIVEVGNPSAQTQRLRLGVTDGVTASNSGSAYGPLESTCTGPACWVIGVPATVTL